MPMVGSATAEAIPAGAAPTPVEEFEDKDLMATLHKPGQPFSNLMLEKST